MLNYLRAEYSDVNQPPYDASRAGSEQFLARALTLAEHAASRLPGAPEQVPGDPNRAAPQR